MQKSSLKRLNKKISVLFRYFCQRFNILGLVARSLEHEGMRVSCTVLAQWQGFCFLPAGSHVGWTERCPQSHDKHTNNRPWDHRKKVRSMRTCVLLRGHYWVVTQRCSPLSWSAETLRDNPNNGVCRRLACQSWQKCNFSPNSAFTISIRSVASHASFHAYLEIPHLPKVNFHCWLNFAIWSKFWWPNVALKI